MQKKQHKSIGSNRCKRQISLFFVLSLFWPLITSTQPNNLGTPFIRNIFKTTYGGGTQNWQFAQDTHGIIYVANNEGLLKFDGQDWQKYPLPNRTIARSLALDRKGRIFVGGQDEVGYFYPTPDGLLEFSSLKRQIAAPFDRFEDVWNLIVTDQGVFFRASDRIYRYAADTITVFATGRPLLFLGEAAGEILVQDEQSGLMRFDGDTFRPTPASGLRETLGIVTALLPYHPDTLLLTTEKQGILQLTADGLAPRPVERPGILRQKIIQAACMLPQNRIALATALGGLITIDATGKISHWISKKDGLQNNNVRSIFTDRDHNVWLGLDNGIDFVVASSPFSRIVPDGELQGTGYAALIHQGQTFFGTSNGLYVAPWRSHFDPLQKDSRFRLVAGTQGQVWGIDKIGSDVLLSHHEGAFQVEGAGARRIGPRYGHWLFTSLQHDADQGISGTYYGINLYSRNNGGQWSFERRLPGLDESCRIFAQRRPGDVWVSHPYRGLYRVAFTPERDSLLVDYFSKADGLPSALRNSVFYINHEIVICTERGVYRWDAERRQFQPYDQYNDLLGAEVEVRQLVQDEAGNVWFVTEEEVGVLRVEKKGLKTQIKKIAFPELRGRLVSGHEFIYPFDAYNVLFGAETGFIHLDPSRLDTTPTTVPTIISKVFRTVDSSILIYGGNLGPAVLPREGPAKRNFPNRQNAFRFHFSATNYEALRPTEYQYQLIGLEKEWSTWTAKTDREYTNLPAGRYTFQVRARLPDMPPGPPARFAFEIQPPWYGTRAAYVFYALSAAGFLVSLVLVPQQKFEKEKKELRLQQQQKEEAHRIAVQQSEQEIVLLRNEKLKAEVQHKNNELISATMHLVQKNELLSKIGDELGKVRQNSDEVQTRKEINKLIKLLKADDQLDKDWEQFAYHFDQVHSDFFKRLREAYPNLTHKDHRLCAYLRMNLSTKEIAPLMNISVRGVEISRYRLRKKLDLDSSENLTEFLMDF